MDPNQRRLQHFVTLVEEKSFARAARRVLLSQPALSCGVQAMKNNYGILLLDQTPLTSTRLAKIMHL